jgi:hypothetical protein
MNGRRLRTLVILAALSSALAYSPRARAQERNSESTVHFRRGVALFERADYAAALLELRRAFALLPNAVGDPCLDPVAAKVHAIDPISPYGAKEAPRAIDATSPYGR